ncbi:quinone oxidoreductase family protein [Pseudogemmobacter sonorensis]|uniref:quinone oxidoreductase family protein n=1 Tax=Pseudogemmobacter sonorensis TaxID=2989681 RepID=UPI0036987E4F
MSAQMNAARLDAAGTPVFGTIDRPTAELPGVPVEVSLAGVNPIDIFLATQPGAGFPRVPGSEGVGLANGARHYFSAVPGRFGSMAEASLAQPERLYPVPDGVSDETAITLGIGGLTAYLSLTDSAALQKGETVLVLGASGVVGALAVQLAKHLGAGRVIAAARNADRLAELAGLGADETVRILDEDTPQSLAERFRAASGGKLDVIIDPVWSVPAVAALMAATRGGRLVQLGHSAGLSVPLAPAFMRGTGAAILGYSSSIAAPEVRRAAYASLCDHALAGDLRQATEIVALSSVAEAWDRQKASPHVKLCLDVRR